MEQICTDLECNEKSLLTPWKKLDMIRTFIQPALTFALSAGEPNKSSLSNYRRKLIETVRNICHLPQRATSHIIFASKLVGGLGFQDPRREADIQTVVQAMKMLASDDKFLSGVARGELARTVAFAAQINLSPSLTQDFLSGLTTGKFHQDNIRYRTH